MSKNYLPVLNSIYGMMEESDPKSKKSAESDRKDLQCKLWRAVWAGQILQEGLRLSKGEFAYCDTDSLKYIGNTTI